MRWLSNSLRLTLALLATSILCGAARAQTCVPVPLIETNLTNDSVSATKTAPCYPVPLIETNLTIDSLSVVKVAHPVTGLSEAVSAIDAVTRVRGVPPVALSEAKTTTDAVTASRANIARNISETLTVTDTCNVSRQIGGAGNCYPVPLIETNLTNDAVAYVRTTVTSQTVNVSESLSTSDSVTAYKPQQQRTLVEIIGGTDALAVLHVVNRGAIEALATVDNVSVAKCGVLHENFTTTDAVALSRSGTPMLFESLSTTDSLARSVGRKLLEQLTTADSLLAQKPSEMSLNLSDAFSLLDTVSAVRSMHTGLAETLAASDAVAASRSMNVNLSDTLGYSDAVSHRLDAVASELESLTTLDQLSVQSTGQISLGIADSFVVDDQLSVNVSLHRSLSENLTVLDDVLHLRGPYIVLTEPFSTADILSATKTKRPVVLLVEITSTADTLTISSPSKLDFAEGFNVVDQVVVQIGKRRFILIEVQ